MEAGVAAHRIALIIPTCGRPDDLRVCLRSVQREADASLVELIVVDDAAPRPVSLPTSVAGVPVRCLRNPVRRGAAYCRNRALPLVAESVDAVGFLDDDVRLCRGWFEAARRELTPARGAVTGPVRRFDRGLVARARQLRYDRRYAPLAPGQPVDFLAGGNALIWRDLLVRAGGFPDTPTMSDRLLTRRLDDLGTSCHFVPEMLVLHRNSKGLRVAVREAWRAGVLGVGPQDASARARLAAGLRVALADEQPAAALLNVALDGVYLTGREHSRRRARTPARAESAEAVAR
jgi:GT2 family glycosyltransferase